MPNWFPEKTSPKPLLDLAYNALFCASYGYRPPDRADIIKALRKMGIEDPCQAMEEWRKEEGIYTDMELHDLRKQEESTDDSQSHETGI